MEYWNHFAKQRRDLFVDVLAIGHGHTVGIQTTSYSNMSARKKKIEGKGEIVEQLHMADWRIVVEGWHKKDGKWVCRRVEL